MHLSDAFIRAHKAVKRFIGYIRAPELVWKLYDEVKTFFDYNSD